MATYLLTALLVFISAPLLVAIHRKDQELKMERERASTRKWAQNYICDSDREREFWRQYELQEGDAWSRGL